MVLLCNQSIDGGDPIGNLTAANIAARTVLQVVDSSNVVRDTETLPASAWKVVSTCSLAPTKACTG